MNAYQLFRGHVEAILADLGRDGLLPANLDTAHVTVEPPRDPSHGDMATNAAMVLAKQARMKPRDIAELLVSPLARIGDVEEVSIAGPGFINMRLRDAFWRARLPEILAAGADYGTSEMGGGEPVNVEYVSANPTGPLHIGHVRGAIYGDALASLLAKAGYSVTREYYINDAGSQIDTLARSTHLRYREALGEDIGEIPEGMYPGDYLIPVGRALAERYGDKWRTAPEAEWLPLFKRDAVAAMMDMIRADLSDVGIRHDVFFSEQSLHDDGRIEAALADLTDKGLIYTGVLEPPKGKTPEDWEPRPQTLFRSTDYGDDVDRPVKKSDGSWTYFAADIAYHYDKFIRGFRQMVLVVGADHGGYAKRMTAAVRATSADQATLDMRLCQMVRVLRDGEPVRMSKRAGDFVTLRDLIEEVGRDVVRFFMLTRKNDAPLDFDFTAVTEQSKDNPVWYVQYAHARIASVFRNAAQELSGQPIDAAALAAADFEQLADSSELALIKRLAAWPRQVEIAAAAHEPHRIAFYLNELASDFHALWNKGNEHPELRFILNDKPALTVARLAMIRCVALVIASGLTVMGVEPAEEMR